jgi:chromosome condensin MukBEF MukE localization factor
VLCCDVLGANYFCGPLELAASGRDIEREKMEDDIRTSLYSNRSSGLVYYAHSTVQSLSIHHSPS